MITARVRHRRVPGGGPGRNEGPSTPGGPYGQKLVEVKKNVESRGGQAEIFPCDLTNVAQTESLLQDLHRRPDGINVFVNNAGKSIRRSIFDSLNRLHDFTRTMNLNYFGPVQLLLSLIPTLVARRGHVINVSAVNVLFAGTKWAAYQPRNRRSTSGFAVSGRLAARGVGMTSIYLPLVRTRMIEPTAAYRNVPAMRPEHVAALICKAINSRRRTYAAVVADGRGTGFCAPARPL